MSVLSAIASGEFYKALLWFSLSKKISNNQFVLRSFKALYLFY